MYSKFLNTATGKTFVVKTTNQNHYVGNKKIQYVGRCEEDGTVTLPADQDQEYINKTLKEQVDAVNANLKKKPVPTAQPQESDTTDVDDEA